MCNLRGMFKEISRIRILECYAHFQYKQERIFDLEKIYNVHWKEAAFKPFEMVKINSGVALDHNGMYKRT